MEGADGSQRHRAHRDHDERDRGRVVRGNDQTPALTQDFGARVRRLDRGRVRSNLFQRDRHEARRGASVRLQKSRREACRRDHHERQRSHGRGHDQHVFAHPRRSFHRDRAEHARGAEAPTRTRNGVDMSKDGFVRKTGVSMRLDDILKGEAITPPLPERVDGSDIDEMLEQAKRRFAERGLWTISATRVKSFNLAARDRLETAFRLFGANGGELVIVWCLAPTVATAFISAASKTGLKLHVVRSDTELHETASAFRKARDQTR